MFYRIDNQSSWISVIVRSNKRYLTYVILAILSSFVSLLGTQFIAREQTPVGRNYVLCYERYGSKVEDDTSGIKSSCCCNDIVMELSSVDRCRIIFACELILLKVGVGYCILLIANGLERKLIAY